MRRIREQCEDPASAIGVYVALTVVASDAESEEFTTTHQWLAALSGFSPRTIRNRLPDLARLGVVAINTPPLRAPSTYRLLPFDKSSPTSGNGCRSLGNGCLALGNGEAIPLPTSDSRIVGKKNARPTTTSVGDQTTKPRMIPSPNIPTKPKHE